MVSKNEMMVILEKLLAGTRSKKADWVQADNSVYRCSFPRSSALSYMKYSSGTTYYGLSILNGEGEQVGDLVSGPTNDLNDPYHKLRQLYESSESNALSIDETLKDILSNLE